MKLFEEESHSPKIILQTTWVLDSFTIPNDTLELVRTIGPKMALLTKSNSSKQVKPAKTQLG
jgi:hypothetical protein